MRLFWAVVGVLIVASAALLLMGKEPAAAPKTPEPAPAPEPSRPQPPAPVQIADATPAPQPQAPSPAAQAADQPAERTAADPRPPAAPKPEPPAAAPEPTAPSEPAPPPSDSSTLNFLESLKPTPKEEPPPPPAAPLAPVKTQTLDDGTLLIDGKYKVKGKGTAEDPYQITWDHLVSTQEDYVPRNGRNELPGRITMLNERYVEIVGNIAFPVMAEQQEDCLVMMNQWDGCCIGIPPTPYDAVEVRLATAVEGKARLTTYGTVRGKFAVEPQLVGGWLIGLYVMDDATLKPQTFGGFAP